MRVKTLFALFTVCILAFTHAPFSRALAADAEVKMKPCPLCQGEGKAKCAVPTCKEGKADCPAPCLKLSKGVWQKMEVKGHAGNRVWQKFSKPGGYAAWNDHHLGEIIEYQNGMPVNVGKCKTCGGTTEVECALCKGTGEAVCAHCQGRKTVPDATKAPSPFFTSQPQAGSTKPPVRFQLKDGRLLVGRKTIVIGKAVTIRTEKGDVEISADDIVKEEPNK